MMEIFFIGSIHAAGCATEFENSLTPPLLFPPAERGGREKGRLLSEEINNAVRL